MGTLFYLMGKSAAGKDTLYEALCAREELRLTPLVIYTTRPIRENETDGRTYFFVDDVRARELEAAGRVIEMRSYDTVCGVWKYFTVDDGRLDLDSGDLLGIGTLESYEKIRAYYGADRVVPIYIEVDDGIRLERALKREQKPQNRKFEEMCRRFLADAADYSEENLRRAGITRRFSNDGDRERCIEEIANYILEIRQEWRRHEHCGEESA